MLVLVRVAKHAHSHMGKVWQQVVINTQTQLVTGK